jgi:anion-transporting  ArsA/GET3 family ATPase
LAENKTGNVLPEGKKLFICLGPGGVGKTSITGALSVIAARQGLRTLAFTIDPARRLANAIGVSDARPGAVIKVEDGFDVLMLNVHDTWEKIVRKYAASPEHFERIRKNRFYEYLTDNFPGFNEYIAVEKLHEILAESDYDLVIVDTPPTSYAMSFLEAPSRILNLLDLNFVRLFFHPYLKLGRFTLRYAAQKESFILRQLAKFTGVDMLRELAMFIFEFEGMFKGFRDRAEEVRDLLRSPQTAFFIVTSAENRRLEEAGRTRERLIEAGYPFTGYVVNRYCWMCAGHGTSCAYAGSEMDEKSFTGDANAAGIEKGLSDRLFTNLKEHLTVQGRVAAEVAALSKQGGGTCLIAPSFTDDIHNLEGLRKLADSLRPIKG